MLTIKLRVMKSRTPVQQRDREWIGSKCNQVLHKYHGENQAQTRTGTTTRAMKFVCIRDPVHWYLDKGTVNRVDGIHGNSEGLREPQTCTEGIGTC